MKATLRIKLGFLTLAMLTAVNAGLGQQTTFTKITTGAIVNDVGTYTRCAWGDFNNDGLLDLFVSNYGGRTNVFYQNNGAGIFTKISQGDPVRDADYHTGTVWGDFDNDGNLDLLVSAGVNAPTPRRNLLYHNNGDGTFSQVSGGTVTNQLGFFDACVWADYDNDGFLDLFITDNGTSSDGGGKNLLFHNNGDGTFTKITTGAVVNDVSIGYGALWADYDNDGFMDLLVVNNSANAVNFLYHNNQNGTFTRVLTGVVATNQWPGGAEGAAWGDYDNDGLPDLFVTDREGSQNRLYHNNGDGTFAPVAGVPMLVPPAGGWSQGCTWGDYDNDGYLDLFVSSHDGQNGLFHNNGNGTFTQILSGDPVNDGGPGIAGNAVSWADYDNDGFLDLFVANGGGGKNFLYHNNGNTNAWLEVKLVGTAANRSAIGAKVRVHATVGGNSSWQLREINNGGGWNVIPLVAYFGLGDATNIDLVRIEWPSGIVQTLTNLAAKQVLTVVEHQQPGVVTPPSFTGVSRSANGAVDLAVTGGAGVIYVFEASANLVNWSKVGVRSNATGLVSFTDTKATNYAALFYRVSVP